MSWLLDTCVLSEYVRKQPERRVLDWLDQQPESQLFVSAVCMAELDKGIFKLARMVDPAQQSRAVTLRSWMTRLRQQFVYRTVPVDDAVLQAWSELSAEADLAGQPLSPMDGLIMASAHSRGLTLVTRNTRDFARYPLLFNPWA